MLNHFICDSTLIFTLTLIFSQDCKPKFHNLINSSWLATHFAHGLYNFFIGLHACCIIACTPFFGASYVVINAHVDLQWCTQRVPDAMMIKNDAFTSTGQVWNVLSRASWLPPPWKFSQRKPQLLMSKDDEHCLALLLHACLFHKRFHWLLCCALLKASLRSVQSRKELQWQKRCWLMMPALLTTVMMCFQGGTWEFQT